MYFWRKKKSFSIDFPLPPPFRAHAKHSSEKLNNSWTLFAVFFFRNGEFLFFPVVGTTWFQGWKWDQSMIFTDVLRSLVTTSPVKIRENFIKYSHIAFTSTKYKLLLRPARRQIDYFDSCCLLSHVHLPSRRLLIEKFKLISLLSYTFRGKNSEIFPPPPFWRAREWERAKVCVRKFFGIESRSWSIRIWRGLRDECVARRRYCV